MRNTRQFLFTGQCNAGTDLLPIVGVRAIVRPVVSGMGACMVSALVVHRVAEVIEVDATEVGVAVR